MIEAKDPIIKRSDLPKILGVHSDTVRKWLKDKRLPEYDVRLSSKTCGWKASTLRAALVDAWPAIIEAMDREAPGWRYKPRGALAREAYAIIKRAIVGGVA